MTELLQLKNISKKYRGFELKDISFSLNKGEILGLLGANGAGKTTIIKIIAGITNKSSGNVIFKDKEMNEDNFELKRHIGIVLDELCLPDYMTVKDIRNITKSLQPNWSDSKFNEYLSKYELPSKKSIGSFSKGMKSRLSIALALAHDPELIIMDEPTSGLDIYSRETTLTDIETLAKEEGKAIIFSSHIADEVERLCDSIVIIEHGKIKERYSKNKSNGMFQGNKSLKDIMFTNMKPDK